jgi:sulfonate transport system permease protein
MKQRFLIPVRKWVGRQLLVWLVPVLILVTWQLLAQSGVISRRIMPAPLDVLGTGQKLLLSGRLETDIAVSTQRAFLGFLIGGSIGFSLGLINGLFPLSESLFDSSIQMIRTVPHLALIPLVILWFGIGEEARLFLIVLGVFFPVYLNTFHGVRTIERGYLEIGKVYGLSPAGQFWQIVLPGALPSILVGVRYALGVMWLTLIVAETISANSGIGYLTMNAREFMQTDVIVLGILVYALLGKLSDAITRQLERQLLRWHPRYQAVL